LKLLTVRNAASRLRRSHGRLLKRVRRARDVVLWRKDDTLLYATNVRTVAGL